MKSIGFFILVFTLFLCGPNTGNGGSSSDFDILKYGAKGNGRDKNTAAINEAIRACADSGGGTVTVPGGEYVTGPIVLSSNVTLFLEAGAVIKGSEDVNDYRNGNRTFSLIRATNARNIAVVGRGVIDGSGTAFMDMGKTRVGDYMPKDLDPRFTRQGTDYMDPKHGEADGPVVYRARPSCLIRFTNCINILVRGVTLRNSPCWTLHLEDCQDADILGGDLINNLLVPNSDGIHCTTCQRVHISDCEISCGDDAVCVTSVGSRRAGVCEDVTVANCTLQSRSSAVRLGYGNNTVRNCTFQNLIIWDSNRGIGVFVRNKGSVENIVFSDIVIHTRLHTGHWWGNAEPIHLSVIPGEESDDIGRIRNITFSNIIAESESGIVVYGQKPGDIRNLSFDNIKLHIKNSPLNDYYGGNFDLRPAHDKRYAIFEHDIPGVFCRHVNGLKLRRFELDWDENLPEFFDHAVFCEQFSNVIIDAFQGRQPRMNDKRAAIVLNGGHCRATKGTETFLQHNNIADERLFVNNDLSEAAKAFEPAKPNFRFFGNIIPE